MQKWKYKSAFVAIIPDERELDAFVDITRGGRYVWQEILEKELAKYGELGWELVAIPESLLECNSLCGYVLFKRPAVE